MDYDAVLRGETVEEVQQKMAAHGKSVHNLDIATMPEEDKQRLLSVIKQE